MAGPSLATAQKKVNETAVSAEATAKILQDTLSQQVTTFDEANKGVIEAANEEKVAKVRLVENRQIDDQNRAAAINEAANLLHVQQGSPEMAILSQQIDLTEAEVFQYSDKLAKMADVSPADDIIGWLGNQIAAPFIQEDLAKKQQNLDVYKKEMQDRNLLAQTRFATIEQSMKRDSAATSAAVVAEAAATASLNAAKLKAEATKSGIEVTNLRFAHNRELLQIAQIQYNTVAEAVRIGIAQQELTLKTRADKRAEETHAEQMKLYREAEEGKKEMLDRINAAAAAAGLTVQFKNAKDFNMLSAKEKEAFSKLAAQYNVASGTINGTYLSQQDFYKTVGVTPPPEMQRAFGEINQVVAAEITKFDKTRQPGTKSFKELEKHVADGLIYKWTQDKWKEQSTIIRPDDFHNPYTFKSLGAFLQTPLGDNMVGTSFVVAPIKGAAAADPNFVLNPQQLVENGVAAGVNIGKTSKEVARVITTMAQDNYQSINGARLGMPPPTSYRVQQQLPDGSFDIVDYMNPTSIANFALKKEFIQANKNKETELRKARTAGDYATVYKQGY